MFSGLVDFNSVEPYPSEELSELSLKFVLHHQLQMWLCHWGDCKDRKDESG